jgi:hypothetical protein
MVVFNDKYPLPSFIRARIDSGKLILSEIKKEAVT